MSKAARSETCPGLGPIEMPVKCMTVCAVSRGGQRNLGCNLVGPRVALALSMYEFNSPLIAGLEHAYRAKNQLPRFALLALLAACGTSHPSDDMDARTIIDLDAAPDSTATTTDAGHFSPDAAPTDPDADAPREEPPTTPRSCGYSWEDGLAEECQPVCTSEVGRRLFGCETEDCILRAIADDASDRLVINPRERAAGILNWLDAYHPPNGCGQCYLLTGPSCWHQFCPVETEAFFDCWAESDDCNASALNACRSADTTGDCAWDTFWTECVGG